MILIIDGHGDEASENFNFKRTAETKANLYSYTKAGIAHQGEDSKSRIKTAVGGDIPSGYCELKKSLVGGTLLKDRVLTPLATSDQPFDQFPAGFVEASDATFRTYYNAAGTICYFSLRPDTVNSILLSQVLSFFNDRPLEVVWAPCRGAGGAALARHKKITELYLKDANKYSELHQKAYGS